jgi:4-alpha-glucanotransferase
MRRAGILVPLFSIPSSTSWGIGEIGDIGPMTRWLEASGQSILQLLPVSEMAPQETSPYSALSGMAIDPQFVSISKVEDFRAIGCEEGLSPELRILLRRVRMAPTVQYDDVRRLKELTLRQCFAQFWQSEYGKESERAHRFTRFMASQAWWLEDYALFRALRERHDERPWTEWPDPLRTREPGALEEARQELAPDILYRSYLQWLADEQWQQARHEARQVALFGDLPFMVSFDSADVWAHQDAFRLDASVGVPPDAFSETGQDWGLPVYRWDVFATRGFDWLRNRARRNAHLFDGYRVDHLVGFYRTYFRPHDGSLPEFTPSDENEQVRLGERVLEVFRGSGAEIIAEDLGVVPDFVRASLERMRVPGYKVFRWERHWRASGQPFKDPVTEYPAVAVATSGTHDTESMVAWWEQATPEDKEAVLAVPSIAERLRTNEQVYDVLIETLYASGADTVILPIQDVFGWRDRINQPGTVGGSNWIWKLPWSVERLSSEPAATAVAAKLREWATKHGRG